MARPKSRTKKTRIFYYLDDRQLDRIDEVKMLYQLPDCSSAVRFIIENFDPFTVIDRANRARKERDNGSNNDSNEDNISNDFLKINAELDEILELE